MKTKMQMGLLVGVLCAGAAPTPDFTSRAVITKSTGTGCGACGEWGWTVMETAAEHYGAEELVVGAYSSIWDWNSTQLGETTLQNTYTNTWIKNMPFPYGPSFSVMTAEANARAENPLNLGDITKNIDTLVRLQHAKIQDIGMNFEAWISGSTVKVARYIQSKTPITGVYSLSTLLLEDSVMHVQAGLSKLTTQAFPHHMVLRTMASTAQRGATLPTRALSGELYVDTVSLAIGGGKPAWNKSKFKIGLVLWNGTNMVNAYTRPVANTWDTFGSMTPAVARGGGSIGVSSAEGLLQVTKDLSDASTVSISIYETSGARIGQYQLGAEQPQINITMPHAGLYLIKSEGLMGSQVHGVNVP